MCLYKEQKKNIYLCVCVLRVMNWNLTDRCTRRQPTFRFRYIIHFQSEWFSYNILIFPKFDEISRKFSKFCQNFDLPLSHLISMMGNQGPISRAKFGLSSYKMSVSFFFCKNKRKQILETN